MWTYLRSYVVWLHEPEHVARFQQYFGVVPNVNRPPDVIPSQEESNLNRNNNNNDVLMHDDIDKAYSMSGVHQRHPTRKILHDSNVLDECLGEIQHSKTPKEEHEDIPPGLDYKITSWFWYYFFQFGAALGNEIFYILFFPIW